MKRIIALMLVIVTGWHAAAQQVNEKSEFPADPVATGPDSPAFFLFPEFYSFWPVDNNDTILKYECFDLNNSLVIADTLGSIDEVKYITLIKTYIDYTHTYIDPDGKPQPLPVTTDLYRYDKDGKYTWTGKNYINNGYIHYKEYRDKIVRADTTSGTNPRTGNKQLTIRKYYKVEPINE